MSNVGDIVGSEEPLHSGWTLKDIRTGRTESFLDEPNNEDIKCFNRRLGYSTSRVITRDEEEKLVVVRPVDKSG